MKIKLLIYGCILLACVYAHGQGLIIKPGTTFKAAGDVSLVVYNGSVANNGNGDFSAASLYLTGGIKDSIFGTGNIAVTNLYIDKSSSKALIGKNISVTNNVVMVSGLLDLNKHNLALSPAGLLVGETEASHIVGAAGGVVSITVDLDAPLGDNPGNLGVTFASTQNFGSTTLQRGHAVQKNSGTGKSIARYYIITPANNTNLNAIVRFKYLDSELNGLTESTLDVWRSTNGGASYADLGADSRNTAQDFINISNVNTMAKFTLSSPTFSFTGKMGTLHALPQAEFVALNWSITPDFKSDKFIIERSVDSTNWYAIGSLPYKDFSVDYSFNDVNPVGDKVYYRVQALNSSNASVTNIAIAQPASKIEVSLAPNPVLATGKLTVNARNAYNAVLKVFAVDGRQVMQQQAYLSKGINQININVNTLAKGMYYLVIEMKDGTKKNIPFIKQ